ncbi:MAG: hypothetical protein IE909_03615 [Campylobacterales bacterium]|nr:hypothetical protein [Campylobacterales bacterium]
MQKNLLLISKTPIVKQIFTLICKKMGFILEVTESFKTDKKFEIIIADQEFIHNNLNNLKPNTQRLGIITNSDVGFDIAYDFTIPLPFLPSTLQAIIDEQIQIINQNNISKKTYVTSVEVPNLDFEQIAVEDNKPSFDTDFVVNSKDDTHELNPALDYLETLAEDIAEDLYDQNDESIVSVASLNKGGVLDVTELTKISSLLGDEIQKNHYKSDDFVVDDLQEDPWQDLSSIIDQAIEEVNSIQKFSQTNTTENVVEIRLNDYNLYELKPLLTLLDQNIIDKLSNGQAITVNLQLDK